MVNKGGFVTSTPAEHQVPLVDGHWVYGTVGTVSCHLRSEASPPHRVMKLCPCINRTTLSAPHAVPKAVALGSKRVVLSVMSAESEFTEFPIFPRKQIDESTSMNARDPLRKKSERASTGEI
ncbi:hypothetical protein H4Q26_009627 [Puccinia striiformis f. sp. tritici PST-130]|nr:hypothetical protein H4Q26_009627 [Puccinia striiformis f. sp. tritici PST-130]